MFIPAAVQAATTRRASGPYSASSRPAVITHAAAGKRWPFNTSKGLTCADTVALPPNVAFTVLPDRRGWFVLSGEVQKRRVHRGCVDRQLQGAGAARGQSTHGPVLRSWVDLQGGTDPSGSVHAEVGEGIAQRQVPTQQVRERGTQAVVDHHRGQTCVRRREGVQHTIHLDSMTCSLQ